MQSGIYTAKYLKAIILPPPCLTTGIKIILWKAVLVLYLTFQWAASSRCSFCKCETNLLFLLRIGFNNVGFYLSFLLSVERRCSVFYWDVLGDVMCSWSNFSRLSLYKKPPHYSMIWPFVHNGCQCVSVESQSFKRGWQMLMMFLSYPLSRFLRSEQRDAFWDLLSQVKCLLKSYEINT